jgi:hypothetical protein
VHKPPGTGWEPRGTTSNPRIDVRERYGKRWEPPKRRGTLRVLPARSRQLRLAFVYRVLQQPVFQPVFIRYTDCLDFLPRNRLQKRRVLNIPSNSGGPSPTDAAITSSSNVHLARPLIVSAGRHT